MCICVCVCICLLCSTLFCVCVFLYVVLPFSGVVQLSWRAKTRIQQHKRRAPQYTNWRKPVMGDYDCFAHAHPVSPYRPFKWQVWFRLTFDLPVLPRGNAPRSLGTILGYVESAAMLCSKGAIVGRFRVHRDVNGSGDVTMRQLRRKMARRVCHFGQFLGKSPYGLCLLSQLLSRCPWASQYSRLWGCARSDENKSLGVVYRIRILSSRAVYTYDIALIMCIRVCTMW